MASALHTLADLLNSCTLTRRDDRERFAAMLAPDQLPELSAEEFAGLLAAIGASRYRAQLTADMDQLRAGLARLLDEGTAIEERLEWLWPTTAKPLPGLGKSVATPLLSFSHKDTYGIWNATSESAMQRLGLMPTFPRGWSTGRQYLLVNRVMVTAAQQLGTDLWTLDELWASVEGRPTRVAARPAVTVRKPAAASASPVARPSAVRKPVAGEDAATFTCRSCFIAKPMAQLSDEDGICKDCSDA